MNNKRKMKKKKREGVRFKADLENTLDKTEGR
jgi:hypothetical protein